MSKLWANTGSTLKITKKEWLLPHQAPRCSNVYFACRCLTSSPGGLNPIAFYGAILGSHNHHAMAWSLSLQWRGKDVWSTSQVPRDFEKRTLLQMEPKLIQRVGYGSKSCVPLFKKNIFTVSLKRTTLPSLWVRWPPEFLPRTRLRQSLAG